MINDFYNQHFAYNVNDIMNIIYNARYQRLDKVSLAGFSQDDISKAIQLYQLNFPDSYDLYLQECYMQGTDAVFTYHDYDDYLFNDKLNEMLTDLQSKIPYTASNYEVVKIIYDYITTNIDYDFDAYPAYNNLDLNDLNQISNYYQTYGPSFTLYGPITTKKGVCQGICLLFKYLLNSFSIDAIVVSGFLRKNGEDTDTGHSVCLVEVDGEQAFVDITSGLHSASPLNVTLYDGFMINEETMFKTFKPMYDEYVFDITTDQLSYYKQYNLEVDSIDGLRMKLNQFILRKPDQVIYLKYTGSVLDKRKTEKLVVDIVASKRGFDLDFDDPIVNEGMITLKIFKRRKRR